MCESSLGSSCKSADLGCIPASLPALLQVRVVQAHGLAAGDWWCGNSDPYCLLRLRAPGGEEIVQYRQAHHPGSVRRRGTQEGPYVCATSGNPAHHRAEEHPRRA